VKPENILFDSSRRRVVLIDFGISCRVRARGRRRELLTVAGTPYYRAPEMFLGGGYDESVDVWAAGVTLFQMMVGRTPFERDYHADTVEAILRGEYEFPKEAEQKYGAGARQLIEGLLRKREERWTAAEALQCEWVRGAELSDCLDYDHADCSLLESR
jgi:calcium-dependent protein kinase